jgi:hypothetical protein
MRHRALSISLLLGLILAALITSGIIYTRSASTTHWVAGALGVVLGLFICSRAAAHLLDLLYRSHYSGPPQLWVWIALNLLTLLAGLILVFAGVMQFTRSTIGH